MSLIQPTDVIKENSMQKCHVFNFQFEHKHDQTNKATNALSRKSEHVTLCMSVHLKASKFQWNYLRSHQEKHVIVDKLFKYANFVTTMKMCSDEIMQSCSSKM